MLKIPTEGRPIKFILKENEVELFIKREDLIHPFISGNKYWKLFYQLNSYVERKEAQPIIITFGGAYSNHIAATSYAAKLLGIASLGIIRGEEISETWQENPTLEFAHSNGMEFHFVSREDYRDKENLKNQFLKKFPDALLVEEGGTSPLAAKGVSHMLGSDTKDFHYLCSAVGTGGTLAGISKYAEENQKVLGFKMVNDSSVESTIYHLSGKNNFHLFEPLDRYGKISDEVITFINEFYDRFEIPLDPIYTGKMVYQLLQLIKNGYFPKGSKVLVFHTGGLQGIAGVNRKLKNQNKTEIKFTK